MTAEELQLVIADRYMVEWVRKKFGRNVGKEYVPRHGVVKCTKLANHTRLYWNDTREYIVGVQVWENGEVVVAQRNILTGDYLLEMFVLPNEFSKVKRRSKHLFKIQPYVDLDDQVKFFIVHDEESIKATSRGLTIPVLDDGGKLVDYIPWWIEGYPETLQDIGLKSAREVMDEGAVYIPFYYKNSHKRAKVGDVIEDQYGIPWRILACVTNRRPHRIRVLNLETNIEFVVMPQLLTSNLIYHHELRRLMRAERPRTWLEARRGRNYRAKP